MDQRKVERTIACDRVSYRVGDTTAREPLRNLSVNGCQIGGALGQFGKGDPIEVTLIDGISVVGVVAWKRDDEFGVAFDRPISDVTVRYLGAALAQIPLRGPELDRFGRPLPPLGRLDNPRAAAR